MDHIILPPALLMQGSLAGLSEAAEARLGVMSECAGLHTPLCPRDRDRAQIWTQILVQMVILAGDMYMAELVLNW